MNRRLFLATIVLTLMSISIVLQAQVSLPHMERIFGGTVRTIDCFEYGSTQSIAIIAAESPRAMFSMTVDHTATNPAAKFSDWEIIPDYEASANHGVPMFFDLHAASEKIFTADDNEGLLSCGLTAGTLTTNIQGMMESVLIKNDYLFAIGETGGPPTKLLFFGDLDAFGSLTQAVGSPITSPTEGYPVMAIHPLNDYLYLLDSQNATSILKSTDTYTNFNASTTFSNIPLPACAADWDGGEMRIGFGPDGKMFLNGQSNIVIQIAMSPDDGTTWTNVDTGVESAGTTMGLNYELDGNASSYEVYLGIMLNTNCGAINSWIQLPRQPGGWVQTHVNMGCVRVDPIDTNILYCTTDQGTGLSTNRGKIILENNEGLTATHIADLDFNLSKSVVWAASKNGAWQTTNFVKNTSWLDATFPDGIANSIAMDMSDTNYNTVYAGSRRVHKTSNGGTSWNQVYTALAQDGSPAGLSDGWVEAIECDSNSVFIGYHGYEQDNAIGLVAWSTNSGTDWSVIETNMDVTDLLLTEEQSTNVLYVALDDSTNAPMGIFTFVPGTATWTHDFTNELLVSDLAEDSTGTVYAAAMTESNDVKVYVRTGSAQWALIPTNGLPVAEEPHGPSDWLGPCLTVGQNADSNKVLYVAIVNEIYFLTEGTNTWKTTPYMQLKEGSVIHVLVWDDLMVGTDIGLYSMDIDTDGDGISDTDERTVYFTNPNKADTDGDGLEDYLELYYSTSPTNTDSDVDGFLDGDEIMAGTNPNDAGSLFEIYHTDPVTGADTGLVIRWSSVTGKLYSLYRSEDLAQPFTLVESDIPDTAPLNVYTDQVATNALYYYEIATDVNMD